MSDSWTEDEDEQDGTLAISWGDMAYGLALLLAMVGVFLAMCWVGGVVYGLEARWDFTRESWRFCREVFC